MLDARKIEILPIEEVREMLRNYTQEEFDFLYCEVVDSKLERPTAYRIIKEESDKRIKNDTTK